MLIVYAWRNGPISNVLVPELFPGVILLLELLMLFDMAGGSEVLGCLGLLFLSFDAVCHNVLFVDRRDEVLEPGGHFGELCLVLGEVLGLLGVAHSKP